MTTVSKIAEYIVDEYDFVEGSWWRDCAYVDTEKMKKMIEEALEEVDLHGIKEYGADFNDQNSISQYVTEILHPDTCAVDSADYNDVFEEIQGALNYLIKKYM